MTESELDEVAGIAASGIEDQVAVADVVGRDVEERVWAARLEAGVEVFVHIPGQGPKIIDRLSRF